MCIRDSLDPFEQAVARPDCDLPSAIENIDIGGPTMVRSAAKNHRDVAIVVDACLLYTPDAADEGSSVDLGGRRIIKNKKHSWTVVVTSDNR